MRSPRVIGTVELLEEVGAHGERLSQLDETIQEGFV